MRCWHARGWDVEADGLFGAPPVTVVVGDEAHPSLIKALGMLGMGRSRVVRVPVDGQGRMLAAEMPALSGPAIVCMQAGNVNTGAFDPAAEICARAHAAGAWVHVDGAFGLWAAASPEYAHLVEGVSRRRFLGHRRPQVAERAVRQRLGIRAGCGGAEERHVGDGRVSAAGRTSRAFAVHAGAFPAGTRCGDLGGAEIAGPLAAWRI